jgi:hypothetical protein
MLVHVMRSCMLQNAPVEREVVLLGALAAVAAQQAAAERSQPEAAAAAVEAALQVATRLIGEPVAANNARSSSITMEFTCWSC